MLKAGVRCASLGGAVGGLRISLARMAQGKPRVSLARGSLGLIYDRRNEAQDSLIGLSLSLPWVPLKPKVAQPLTYTRFP